MRETDGSSRRFRKIPRKGVAALGAGLLLGAGVLVLAPRAAHATSSNCGSTGEQECFTGASNNFNAVPNVATGNIVVGTFTDTDGGGDVGFVVNWGDLSSDTNAIWDQGTGNITDSHTYTNPGLYPVTIDVSDGDEGTGTVLPSGNSGTTELSDGSAFVVDFTGSTTSFSATEGNLAGPGIVADFTEYDGSCSSPQEISAQINWGDGASSPGTIDCNADTVSGSHTYSNDEGTTLPVTVDMSENGDEPNQVLPSGNSGNAELSGGTVTIADANITPSATPRNAVEGAGFSASLGTISDGAGASADPADYSVARTCYNDTGPGGLPTPAANKPQDCVSASLTPKPFTPGSFIVNGSGVFNEEGTFDVQTLITDGEGPNPQMITMDSYVTVGDAAITATPVSTIQAKKGNTFKKTVANFKDADPHGTTSDYTASISWGDGATTSGTIAPNGMGGWSVTGTHLYTAAQGYAVTITVTDAGGASNSTVTQVRAK